VRVLVPIAYDVILGVAFLYYWPTAKALVSRTAPAALRATMMGMLFLSSFVSDIALGWIGIMSPAAGTHPDVRRRTLFRRLTLRTKDVCWRDLRCPMVSVDGRGFEQ
jgi:hypothetical protein